MAAELLRERLPPPWNYDVTRDGRVFFINEESKCTTWLHPVYNQPVQSGHYFSQELPVGWEESMTAEGAPYYIDHMNLRTTFHHPITGEAAAINIAPNMPHRKHGRTFFEKWLSSPGSGSRDPHKGQGKKKKKLLPITSPTKRKANTPVTFKGWLYIQDHGTLKSWKRRWCVLADYILNFYKGLDESQCQGSMPLPSFKISPCTKQDKINKKFAFKAEHQNMQTQYFSAEVEEEMRQWINALNLASNMQKDPLHELEYNNNFLKPVDPDDMEYWRAPTKDYSLAPQNNNRYSTGSEHLNRSMNRNYPHWSDEDDSGGGVRDEYDGQREQEAAGDLKRWGAQDLQRDPERTWYETESYGSEQPSYERGSLASRDNPHNNSFRPNDSQNYPGDRGSYLGQRDSLTRQPPSQNSTLTREPPTSQQSMLTGQPGPSRDSTLTRDPDGYRPVSQSSGNWGHQPQDQEDGFYGHYSPRKAEANFVPRNNERGSYAGSGQPGMDPRESYASSRPDSYSDRGREWYQDSPLQRSMSGPVYNTQPKWGESLQPFDQNPRESTRSLHIDVQDRNEWHQPRDRSSGSLHSPRLQAKHAAQTQSSPTERNPIYENLSADLSPGSPKPQRPPLPAAYRQQIAHELAETKTPKTKEFMLTAAEMEQKRRSDPHYFQYPESPEQENNDPYNFDRSPTQSNQPYDDQSPTQSNQPYGDRREQAYPREQLGAYDSLRREQPERREESYMMERQPSNNYDSLRRDQPGQREDVYPREQPGNYDSLRRENPEWQRESYPSRQQPGSYDSLLRPKPERRDDSLLRDPLNRSYDSRQSASSRNSQRPDSFTGSNDPNRLSGISARSDDKYNSLPLSYLAVNGKVVSQENYVIKQTPNDNDLQKDANLGISDIVRQWSRTENAPHEIPEKCYKMNTYAHFLSNQDHGTFNETWRPDTFKLDDVPVKKKLSMHVEDLTASYRESIRNTVPELQKSMTSPSARLKTNGSLNQWLSRIQNEAAVPVDDRADVPKKTLTAKEKKSLWLKRRKGRSLTFPRSEKDTEFKFHDLDIDLELPWDKSRPWSISSPFLEASAFVWAANGSHKLPQQTSHSVEVLTDRPGQGIVLGVGAKMIKQARRCHSDDNLLRNESRGENGYHPYNQGQGQRGDTLYPQSAPQTSAAPPRSPAVGLGRRNIPANQGGRAIDPIKEDPNMPDADVLNTDKLLRLQNSLMGNRLRLSISAGDLVGKTHEELVLLLIQLRRSQARLEGARDWYRKELDITRDYEKEYKKERESMGHAREELEEGHDHYVELKKQNHELEKRLEVNRPLVNLVDNLVTMGSLYGGDNVLLMSEYKKHKLAPGQYSPPKKMIEFSRQHQEHRLHEEQEEGIRQLTEEEVNLEEKLEKLFELDRELQEQSYTVTSLQEDRELLEKALVGIREQEAQEEAIHIQPRLAQQRHTVEDELTKVRQQLADSFKILEEKSVENAKVENEVILLRKKIARGLNRNPNSPGIGENARDRQRLAEEVENVQSLIDGLSQQGAQLSNFMSALKPQPPPPAPDLSKMSPSTYAETDLDTMVTCDLATASPMVLYKKSSPPPSSRLTGPHPSFSTSDIPQQMARERPMMVNNLQRSGSMGLYPNKQNMGPYYENLHRRERSLDDDQFNTHPDGSYSHLDMNDADDNTKRYFGLLPRDKPKAVTVRDVKKRESVRKDNRRRGDGSFDGSDTMEGPLRRTRSLPRKLPEHSSMGPGDRELPRPRSSRDIFRKKLRSQDDSEKRRSATERLFPSGQIAPAPVIPPLTKDKIRRLSDLVSPRPFSLASRDSTTSSLLNTPTTSMLNSTQPVYRSEQTLEKSLQSEPLNASRNSNLYSSDRGLYRSGYQPGPRPYSVGSERGYERPVSASFSRNQPASVATVRPNMKPDITAQIQENNYPPWTRHQESTPASIAKVKPMSPADQNTSWQSNATSTWESPESVAKDRSHIKDRHRKPRGRFMTVSSSEPIKFDLTSPRRKKYNTAAGDLINSNNLPDLVKGENTIDPNIDDETIDREVLFMPNKVEIPERYIPDSDDDEVVMTDADRRIRADKAEKIRKMLAAHSLQEWTEREVNLGRSRDVHDSIKEEKQRREHVLDIRQALANEVKQKSREVAEQRRLVKSMENLNMEADMPQDMGGSYYGYDLDSTSFA